MVCELSLGKQRHCPRWELQANGSDNTSRSSMVEHEHGVGASGLSRIRQQPPPRIATVASSGSSSRNASIGPRSASLTLLSSNPRASLGSVIPSGPSSPNLAFTEDLSRFPSESLHSFSFAHQSDEFIHNRHTVLKRSVEFMSQKLGWGPTNAGIASAQARVSGDQETQGMLELLAKANLVGASNISGVARSAITGPLTGPPLTEDAPNIFDASFHPRSVSPEDFTKRQDSLKKAQKAMYNSDIAPNATEPVKFTDGNLVAEPESESSSRAPTNESRTTAQTSPPATRRQSLKRTYTDTTPLHLQHKLMDALAQPYVAGDSDGYPLSPTISHSFGPASFGKSGPQGGGPHVHGHSRWAPAAQAIFTTQSTAPYTILAANDLACLVFGVTKAEVRKLGILEVVQQERRSWLEEKLSLPGMFTETEDGTKSPAGGVQSQRTSPTPTTSFFLGKTGGVTASLLSKPNSRQQKPARRAQTDDGAGSSIVARRKATVKGNPHHAQNKSRGVLLCGDVVPIQKRNGVTGSASLWVKEKRGGLIWVLEEILEDVAILSLDDDAEVTKVTGSSAPIWGENVAAVGMDISTLIPRIPRQGYDGKSEELDYAEVAKRRYFTARNSGSVNVPCVVDRVPACTDLRVSSFPHIAGIMVLRASTLKITSSNSVFSGALFGQEKPDGRHINELIPQFDKILNLLTEEDGVNLVEGLVIPEHSFRRAKAFLALRDGQADAAAFFLRPDGLPGKHRDGSEIKIDVQLRVVQSGGPQPVYNENVIEERSDEEDDLSTSRSSAKSAYTSELVYALWITYSRHIHATAHDQGTSSPMQSGMVTPLHQPSPGQKDRTSPVDMDSDEPKKEASHASLLAAQLKAAAKKSIAKVTGREPKKEELSERRVSTPDVPETPVEKKTIDDFVILEEMGQGAYGQVKLGRYKKTNQKMVLKYVTKRRILVDTWTRDRRLGTVPLEIHVLDYLRRDGFQHPNIVEMSDFFEDSINYYIEMVPHGLPGMDLFDYIELRVNMEENECRSIFVQVAKAVHHLHTKAKVVHRDIKDENVVLDGEGNVKLIDFGSAAYIKSAPFDVFVGTIGMFPVTCSVLMQSLIPDRLRSTRSPCSKAL